MDNTNKEKGDHEYQLVQKLDIEVSKSISSGQKDETVILSHDGEDSWAGSSFGDDDDTMNQKINIVSRYLVFIRKHLKSAYSFVQKLTQGYFVAMVCIVAYIGYFITAMCYKFGDEGSHRLLACTVLSVVIAIRHKIYEMCRRIFRRLYGASELTLTDKDRLSKIRYFARWISSGGLAAGIVWSLIEEGREKPDNLRSLPGLVLFNLLPLIFSTRPSKINWYMIYWSNGLQFLCAITALKWKFGRESMLWIQDRFDSYFANSKAASLVIFGPTYTDHQLIFNSIPLILYSAATIAVLYYLGVMQVVIKGIGSIFKFTLNTSRVESSTVSLGIFTEGVTTLMTIRPFLKTLTKSQMFTVVTSSFTSLGGAYIAILTTIGVSIEYILPAMLVSAPACFTVCKLIIPDKKMNDDEQDITDETDIFIQEKKRYTNVLDAFQAGAFGAVSLFANIVVMFFVFMCLITWLNSTLAWFGDRVGIDNMSIELISSYVLYPISLAMGVETLDCRRVAFILGYRIGFNNIIAFFKLTEMKVNKHQYLMYMMKTNGTGLVTHVGMDISLQAWNMTLTNGYLTDRSEVILTYCLCGFSSILTVCITLSLLSVMIPERKAWLSKIAIPSLIAANIANCMTGCYASIFY